MNIENNKYYDIPMKWIGLSYSKYIKEYFPSNKSIYPILVVVSAVFNLLLLSGSIFMLMVYDEILPSYSFESLIGLSFFLMIALGFQGSLEHLRNRIVALTGRHFEQSIARSLLQRTLDAEVRRSIPDTAQPSRDLDVLHGFFASTAPMALLDLPWIPIFLGVIFSFHWILGLVCLIGGAIVVLIAFWTDKLAAAEVAATTQNNASRLRFLENARQNAEIIQALGMQEQITGRWTHLSQVYTRQGDITNGRLSTLRTFSRTFRLFLQSLILATGAALVIAGQATGGVIIASSILSSRALGPIDSIIANWQILSSAKQAWNRLANFLKAEAGEDDRTLLPRPSHSLSIQKAFAVAPGTQTILLRDISFAITAGEVLAIVGASGSGKSSLARLLVGVISPIQGSVRLDGAALDQWEPDVLGKFVGYLPQDVGLFEGTIAENISRFDRSATSEEIVAAAVQAGVHDMIVRMSDGYDSAIGAGGRGISAGQRQRIALARALFREPFLIVLDEPNSNLDGTGDEALNRALALAKSRGAIIIIVAHRPSSLATVDKLLWLDNGAVREFGTKAEVLPRITASTAAPAGNKASADRSAFRAGNLKASL